MRNFFTVLLFCLWMFNLNAQGFTQRFLTGLEITCLAKTNSGVIVVGTSKNGLWRYENNTFVQMPIILSNQRVKSLEADQNGGLWATMIGTTSGTQAIGGGVYYFENPATNSSPVKWAVGEGLHNRAGYGLSIGDDMRVWVAHYPQEQGPNDPPSVTYGGISWMQYINGGVNSFVDFSGSLPPGGNCFSKYCDAVEADGTTCWLGMHGEDPNCSSNLRSSTITRFNSAGVLLETIRADSFVSGTLQYQLMNDGDPRAIYKEPNGNVWIGFGSGYGGILFRDKNVSFPDWGLKYAAIVPSIIPNDTWINRNAIWSNNDKIYFGTNKGVLVHNLNKPINNIGSYKLFNSSNCNQFPTNNVTCGISWIGDTILIGTDSGLIKMVLKMNSWGRVRDVSYNVLQNLEVSNPVLGAKVSLIEPQFGVLLETITTDSTGQFSFNSFVDDEKYKVIVEKDAYTVTFYINEECTVGNCEVRLPIITTKKIDFYKTELTNFIPSGSYEAIAGYTFPDKAFESIIYDNVNSISEANAKIQEGFQHLLGLHILGSYLEQSKTINEIGSKNSSDLMLSFLSLITFSKRFEFEASDFISINPAIAKFIKGLQRENTLLGFSSKTNNAMWKWGPLSYLWSEDSWYGGVVLAIYEGLYVKEKFANAFDSNFDFQNWFQQLVSNKYSQAAIQKYHIDIKTQLKFDNLRVNANNGQVPPKLYNRVGDANVKLSICKYNTNSARNTSDAFNTIGNGLEKAKDWYEIVGFVPIFKSLKVAAEIAKGLAALSYTLSAVVAARHQESISQNCQISLIENSYKPDVSDWEQFSPISTNNIEDIVDQYNQKITIATNALVNLDTAQFFANYLDVLSLEDSLDSAVQDALYSIEASYSYSNIAGIDTAYYKYLQNTLFVSPGNRLSTNFLLLSLSTNIDSVGSNIALISDAVEETKNSNYEIISEINLLNSLLENVYSPGYISVVKSDVRDSVLGSGNYIGKIYVKNYGNTIMNNLFSKVQFLNNTAMVIEDSIWVGNLLPGQSKAFTFNYKPLGIADTFSVLEVSFNCGVRNFKPYYKYIVIGNTVNVSDFELDGDKAELNALILTDPMPFHDNVRISLGKTILDAQTCKLRVFSQTGEMVYQKNGLNIDDSGSAIINLSILPDGIYYLLLTTPQGQYSTKITKHGGR